MKLSDVMGMGALDVNRLTAQELRKAVQVATSAANKRLKRLGESEKGQMSPAYQKAMERAYQTAEGGKFGTAGKNRNQLLAELKATKDFLSKKTSTVSGFNKVRKERAKRMGGEFATNQGEAEYWAAYRRLEELHPEIIGHHGSDEVQQMLFQMMEEGSFDEYLDEINDENAPDDWDEEDDVWFTEDGQEMQFSGTMDDYIAIVNELLRLEYEGKQKELNEQFKPIEERDRG